MKGGDKKLNGSGKKKNKLNNKWSGKEKKLKKRDKEEKGHGQSKK